VPYRKGTNMARVEFELDVLGGGEIDLGVAILSETPVILDGLETKNVVFALSNSLTRPVTITLSITKEGTAKDKATVSLLNDSMVITPGMTSENQLIIEANEAMVEGDVFLVRVTGTEGV
jgi:hypothetical protein